MLVALEREIRSLNPVDWGEEYQLIAFSGKLHIPIFVFNHQLFIPQWIKMKTETGPNFNHIQVYHLSFYNVV